MFKKSSLNFTFGQDDCRESDYARPNWNKPVLLKISKDWLWVSQDWSDVSPTAIK